MVKNFNNSRNQITAGYRLTDSEIRVYAQTLIG